MANNLRSKIIRLAYEKPALRPHLLPLVATGPTKTARYPDIEREPDQAMKHAERIVQEVDEALENRLALWWGEVRDLQEQMRWAELKWDREDPQRVPRQFWKWLEDRGLINKNDREFVEEVVASYGW
jgi:hypothetical protein